MINTELKKKLNQDNMKNVIHVECASTLLAVTILYIFFSCCELVGFIYFQPEIHPSHWKNIIFFSGKILSALQILSSSALIFLIFQTDNYPQGKKTWVELKLWFTIIFCIFISFYLAAFFILLYFFFKEQDQTLIVAYGAGTILVEMFVLTEGTIVAYYYYVYQNLPQSISSNPIYDQICNISEDCANFPDNTLINI